MRVAINGLGRTGRQALRQIFGTPGLIITGLNDVAEASALAHLLKYDSLHGRAPFRVSLEEGALVLDGHRVPLHREADPAAIPFEADLVLECTGRFTSRQAAAAHLKGEVRRVIVSAPCEDADFTVLPGVNDHLPALRAAAVLSAACPAAHALAPLVQILDGAFGVACGLATVVESFQNDQRILDLPHPDLRMGRAAALSMIPAPSQAARCLEQAMPSMAGRFQALAVRVPTPDVSLLDLCLTLERDATADAVHAAFREAEARMPHLLETLEDPLVSTDLRGNPRSCVLDPMLTRIMAPRFIKVFAWHDNEVAYAARLKDLCAALAGEGGAL